MYTDIPFWLSLVMIVAGLAALAWSSDLFVDGAAKVAKALGISPFVIGMVIIGFGTSAPELCVSVMSGFSGHSNLSLGNAYGSCIFNIAVILGVAVMVFPLVTRPAVTYVAGPGLAAISLFSMFVLRDGSCSRVDAAIFIAVFLILLPLYCWFDQKTKAVGHGRRKRNAAPSGPEPEENGSIIVAVVKLVVGFSVLVGSSHILVWGAVDFAKFIGVSDLVIGLTIVAAGTSLPELASAVASARRGEHEFVLGNIIGSNLFNMLAVVGLACVISPVDSFSPYVLKRDLPLLTLLSISILFFGVNRRHPMWPGVIKRRHAAVWLIVFTAYTVLMFLQETGKL